MIRYVFVLSFFALLVFVFDRNIESAGLMTDKVFRPNLSNIVKGKGWNVVNRNVSRVEEDGRKGIRFDENKDVGIAWLDNYEFRDGTIEFDVKGKNVLQKSFVGVAFQASDDAVYDVIYFRPFNFKSEDPERRGHAVQYIASPDHDWKELRQQFPAKYEQPIVAAPDPAGWFHARVVVDGKKVSVFVDNAASPSLVVEKLTESRMGNIGLWVGDQSDGAFANLKITSSR